MEKDNCKIHCTSMCLLCLDAKLDANDILPPWQIGNGGIGCCRGYAIQISCCILWCYKKSREGYTIGLRYIWKLYDTHLLYY